MSLEVETCAPPPLAGPPPGPEPSDAAPMSITKGCLSAILQGSPLSVYPVLQVLTVKKTVAESGAAKYRMVLSDGDHYLLGEHTSL